MTHGYNNDDEPNAVVGAYSYVQSTAYSAYNQVAQVQLGSSTSYSTVTDGYDAHTGDLADQLVTRSTTTPASVDETAYRYDLSGNITRQTETRSGSSATSETQCFGYDTLDRLTRRGPHRQLRRHPHQRRPQTSATASAAERLLDQLDL